MAAYARTLWGPPHCAHSSARVTRTEGRFPSRSGGVNAKPGGGGGRQTTEPLSIGVPRKTIAPERRTRRRVSCALRRHTAHIAVLGVASDCADATNRLLCFLFLLLLPVNRAMFVLTL